MYNKQRTQSKKFTKGQIQVYKELRNGHYIVSCWRDGQSWLMKDREKVRVINHKVRFSDVDLFGLVEVTKVGSTNIYTAMDSFKSSLFLRGNIAQLNCKEAADKSLTLLESVWKG